MLFENFFSFLAKEHKDNVASCYRYAGFDRDGVIHFKDGGGRLLHNPFEVALQASHGRASAAVYNRRTTCLEPRYTPIDTLADPRPLKGAAAAMDWLLRHEKRRDAAGVWEYDYPVDYAGDHIAPPWVSAYGQAHVALAMLHWRRHTREVRYLEAACRAMRAVVAPLAEGGLRFDTVNGAFFEELPNATHIFNAHLMCLLALHALMDAGEEAFRAHWSAGLRGFVDLLEHMDTGVWSAYDIPKKLERVIQCRLSGPVKRLALKTITIQCGDTVIQCRPKAEAGGNLWLSGTALSLAEEGLAFTNTEEDVVQHNYINIDIPLDSIALDHTESIEIRIRCIADNSGSMICHVSNNRGRYVRGDKFPVVPVTVGEQTLSCIFKPQMLFPPLSTVYHKYHIHLLDCLYKQSRLAIFRHYREIFSQYMFSYQ